MKTFIVFILISIPLYLYMQHTQTVTSDFSDVAPHFYIVGESEGDYHIISLKKAYETGNDYKYHLDNSLKNYGYDSMEIFIEILENSKNKQRIRVKSTNTAMIESIYDVVNNKVLPIKYRVIVTMGYPFIFFLVFIASLILTPIISWVVYLIWQKQSKKT